MCDNSDSSTTKLSAKAVIQKTFNYKRLSFLKVVDFFLKYIAFELILNIYPSFSWNPFTQVLTPKVRKYSFLRYIFLTNSKPMEGGWDSAEKHVFAKDKLRLEMKNKLKSGLENKYFANRPSCKRMRNGQE